MLDNIEQRRTMTNPSIFREWNDRKIRIRPEDRYVCLTDMAKAAGKLYGNWRKTEPTQSYLEALSRSILLGIDQLIQVIKTGPNELRGTWAHPKIAIRFAQWCSDEFAIQVDFWIDELLTTGKVELTPTPIEFPHILEEPRQWEKLYTQEFCKKVFKWQGGYFFHIWIYDHLTSEEREYINAVNPTQKGRRKARIHQYLSEEAAKVLEKKLTPIFVIADIANSYDEFQNLHNRLKGNYQLNLPGVLG